jgi:hypothetical protein
VLAELPDKVVNALSDPIELQDICRVSSDGLPDFDFTIDGEAAWAVSSKISFIVKSRWTTIIQVLLFTFICLLYVRYDFLSY